MTTMAEETKTNSTEKKHEEEYFLSYQFRVNDPPLTYEQAKSESEETNWGATHAMFMASICDPPDGSLSIYFLSKDGRNGLELPDSELFKVWMLLTNRLTKSQDQTIETPVMLDNYNSGSFYEELVYEPDETVVIHQPFRIKETTQ